MAIDTKELRRLAQAATPGHWQFWHGWIAADIDNDGGVIIVERPTQSGGKYQARVDNNFKFIAAANPAAISELLERLEAAEKERDNANAAAIGVALQADALQAEIDNIKEVQFDLKVSAVAEGWRGKCERLEKERDVLKDKIEATEKRLHLILEEPENTMSNSKAMREMLRQARLALEELK